MLYQDKFYSCLWELAGSNRFVAISWSNLPGEPRTAVFRYLAHRSRVRPGGTKVQGKDLKMIYAKIGYDLDLGYGTVWVVERTVISAG